MSGRARNNSGRQGYHGPTRAGGGGHRAERSGSGHASSNDGGSGRGSGRGLFGNRGNARGLFGDRGNARGDERGRVRGRVRGQGQGRGGGAIENRAFSYGGDGAPAYGGGATENRAFSYGGNKAPAYDQRTKEAEDKLMEVRLGYTGSSSSLSKNAPETLALQRLSIHNPLPARPGFGTRGDAVLLWANYFEIKTALETLLYKYSIMVQPDAAGKKLEQIVRLLLSENTVFSDRQASIASDFRSTLITRQKLPPECLQSFKVTYRTELENDPGTNAKVYTLTIQDTGESLPMQDLLNYLNSTSIGTSYAARESMIQALNIVAGDHAKRSTGVVSRGISKCFSLGGEDGSYDLGRGLQAFRGFFSSVRLATNRILINVNVTHAAFYPSKMLDELILDSKLISPWQLQTFLKGLKVQTSHIKDMNGKSIERIKTIYGLAQPKDGFALKHPPKMSTMGAGAHDVQFWLEEGGPYTTIPEAGANGKYISVAEFFAKSEYVCVVGFIIRLTGPAYKVMIPKGKNDRSVINVGNREHPVYLPPAVCKVAPGQAYSKKLHPDQTSRMINFAVRKPWQNAQSISRQGLERIDLLPSENSKMSAFQLEISPELITVPARVLKPLGISYMSEKENKPRNILFSSGGWNMRDIRFMQPKPLSRWGYLFISNLKSPDGRRFATMPKLPEQMTRLQGALRKVGINASEPTMQEEVLIETDEDPSVQHKIQHAKNIQLQLLFIILPGKEPALYNYIKRLADVEIGVHTTCATCDTLRKQLDKVTHEPRATEIQLLTNLALKINLKLGGTNQVVETSSLPIIKEDKTMFIGIDVTHPSPGSLGNTPSVAAVVANYDKNMGQWPADMRLQLRTRGEMVEEVLKDMIKSRLDIWRKKRGTNSLPENLMIYRDGVGESQYQTVLDVELPQIRAAWMEANGSVKPRNGLPRITIAVVGKRHNTRFYPTSQETMDPNANCLSGTVVDRGITDTLNWDFYLQAHSAIKGTARPAHYQVLLNEIFTGKARSNADVFEELTLAMSQVFGRATKIISYATPARYADMVCERARAYLSAQFDPKTPESSSASSASGQITVNDLAIQVHPDLRNSMFYV